MVLRLAAVRVGNPRGSPDGIISREGVIYACLACVAGKHEFHPGHSRNGEHPLLCKHYQFEFGDCVQAIKCDELRNNVLARCIDSAHL